VFTRVSRFKRKEMFLGKLITVCLHWTLSIMDSGYTGLCLQETLAILDISILDISILNSVLSRFCLYLTNFLPGSVYNGLCL
jgi:hypothetical protein